MGQQVFSLVSQGLKVKSPVKLCVDTAMRFASEARKTRRAVRLQKSRTVSCKCRSEHQFLGIQHAETALLHRVIVSYIKLLVIKMYIKCCLKS